MASSSSSTSTDAKLLALFEGDTEPRIRVAAFRSQTLTYEQCKSMTARKIKEHCLSRKIALPLETIPEKATATGPDPTLRVRPSGEDPRQRLGPSREDPPRRPQSSAPSNDNTKSTSAAAAPPKSRPNPTTKDAPRRVGPSGEDTGQKAPPRKTQSNVPESRDMSKSQPRMGLEEYEETGNSDLTRKSSSRKTQLQKLRASVVSASHNAKEAQAMSTPEFWSEAEKAMWSNFSSKVQQKASELSKAVSARVATIKQELSNRQNWVLHFTRRFHPTSESDDLIESQRARIRLLQQELGELQSTITSSVPIATTHEEADNLPPSMDEDVNVM